MANFVGKLLGPKGNTLRRLQEDTGTKMAVLGRGSMKDKKKEDEMRSEGGKFAHLNEELHLNIECFGLPLDCHRRILLAMEEIRKFLVPDYDDDIRNAQMQELMYLNGGELPARGRGRGRGGMGGPSRGGHPGGNGGLLETPAGRGGPRGGMGAPRGSRGGMGGARGGMGGARGGMGGARGGGMGGARGGPRGGGMGSPRGAPRGGAVRGGGMGAPRGGGMGAPRGRGGMGAPRGAGGARGGGGGGMGAPRGGRGASAGMTSPPTYGGTGVGGGGFTQAAPTYEEDYSYGGAAANTSYGGDAPYDPYAKQDFTEDSFTDTSYSQPEATETQYYEDYGQASATSVDPMYAGGYEDNSWGNGQQAAPYGKAPPQGRPNNRASPYVAQRGGRY